jgi:cytochrome c-type biogenesis protein CcmH
VRLLAAGLVALALAGPAVASEEQPTLADLEDEVVCPVCAPQTLDQSSSAIARNMKRFIAERIAAGDTKTEIKQALVAEFGPGVLAAPPKEGFDLLAWLLPLVGLGLGLAALTVAAWRWSVARDSSIAASSPNGSGPIEPELERRLDEELARFDA